MSWPWWWGWWGWVDTGPLCSYVGRGWISGDFVRWWQTGVGCAFCVLCLPSTLSWFMSNNQPFNFEFFAFYFVPFSSFFAQATCPLLSWWSLHLMWMSPSAQYIQVAVSSGGRISFLREAPQWRYEGGRGCIVGQNHVISKPQIIHFFMS